MKRVYAIFLYLLMIIPLIFILGGCNTLSDSNNNEEFEGLKTIDDSSLETEKNKNSANNTVEVNTVSENKDDEPLISLSNKNTVFDIDSGGRMSPFVPYKEKNLMYPNINFGDLPMPPISGIADEGLDNLVSAKVTGILYDSKSPSAIINVMGEDYLVKTGDEVETFRISGISKDYVAIKTGTNIYRAKVGDIVDGELYGTGVYNLGHKFAGRRHPARNEDILVVKTGKKSDDKNTTDNTNAGFNELSLPPIPEIYEKRKKALEQADTNALPTPPTGAPSVPKKDTN